MSEVRFLGGAQPVRQVSTFTISGTIVVGQTATITIGNSSFVYTAASTTIATEAAAMAAALTAAVSASSSTYPEFVGLTCAYTSAGSFTITGPTDGKPFTATVSDTLTGSLAVSTTTAAVSTKSWGSAGNWSGAAVPVDNDNVYVENTSLPILYGLDQSGIQPTKLYIAKSYTGSIGLPQRNNTGYAEYLDDYLKIGPASLIIGRGDGSGSGRIKINTGTDIVAGVLEDSGSGAESGLEAVLWKGTYASNTWTVLGGSLGVAVFGGEVATILTLKIVGGKVRCGPGSTLTTVQVSGKATVDLYAGCTTLTMDPGAGNVTIYGSGAFTTVNVYGGTLDYQSTGTIGTLNVGGGGKVTFENNNAARTVTATNVYKGAYIRDRNRTVTWTGNIAAVGCSYTKDVDIDLGIGVH